MTILSEAYTAWKFLWPPRPENKIPPSLLNFYDRTAQWVAQVKKNGTCTIIGRQNDQDVYTFTRHNTEHTLWKADYNSPSLRALKPLGNQWIVFEAEVLHSKVAGIRDTVCLFDLLVLNGEILTGLKWSKRMEMLYRLFPPTYTDGRYFGMDMIDERLGIIRPIFKDFQQVFNELERPEDEGLVLKDPNSILLPMTGPSSNSQWQIKCRRPSKNYSF